MNKSVMKIIRRILFVLLMNKSVMKTIRRILFV